MAEYITDHSTPCRPCRGTGLEPCGNGRKTACFDCGGSGRKSVRVESRVPVVSSEMPKNRDSVIKPDIVDDVAQGWPELNP